jgi:glycosyltransferase involved in cell wall biosynthesis
MKRIDSGNKKNHNKKGKGLVSIVIPTKNSSNLLKDCFDNIKHQSYQRIEVIVVDGNSIDNAEEITKKYKFRFYKFTPKVKKGLFDAPHKINYGAKKAIGEYIYWVDADMELTKNVVKEAVEALRRGADAVIIPEESFGKGIWARAKQLERRCYWGDDTVESPRFLKKSLWSDIGGFDEVVGGGGNDWDLHLMVKERGGKVARIKSLVMHNEGDLTLMKLIRKRFMYGREALNYISKRPKASFVSFFPFRKAFFVNWRLFIPRPVDTIAFIIMRTVEYTAGFLGIVYAKIRNS